MKFQNNLWKLEYVLILSFSFIQSQQDLVQEISNDNVFQQALRPNPHEIVSDNLSLTEMMKFVVLEVLGIRSRFLQMGLTPI